MIYVSWLRCLFWWSRWSFKHLRPLIAANCLFFISYIFLTLFCQTLKVGQTRRWAGKAGSLSERSTQTGPELQGGTDHQDQPWGERVSFTERVLNRSVGGFEHIKLGFSQNIKKKDPGGAKPRPTSGGLLPPPPGNKPGGAVLPPPGGQQPVSAAQINTGDPPFRIKSVHLT